MHNVQWHHGHAVAQFWWWIENDHSSLTLFGDKLIKKKNFNN